MLRCLKGTQEKAIALEYTDAGLMNTNISGYDSHAHAILSCMYFLIHFLVHLCSF